MKTLAEKLQATAQGAAFYGEALREAYELPYLTYNEKHTIHRYMHGAELRSDRFRLQDIAIMVDQDGRAVE